MEIKYLGHSSFRLKGKGGVVVTDPFDSKMVGLSMSKVKADMVTVSHGHDDHNQVDKVSPNTREEVFEITRPGEYEVSGITVMGVSSWHDDKKGEERGENIIYTYVIDDVIVCHLGDLGHVLSDKQVERISPIDVLLVPVGGKYTIGPADAVKVIEQLSPSIVIPMHYKKEGMGSAFDELSTLADFVEKAGVEFREEEKLSLTQSSLPEELEMVVLKS